jgi:hypothetical protein
MTDNITGIDHWKNIAIYWKNRAYEAEYSKKVSTDTLREIATQDDLYLALDPTWSKRQVQVALAKLEKN